MDGQRSAFALLQQAAKRRTPGSRGKQAGSSSKKQKSQPVASAFMPCPVCQASVPKALITSHVNSCLEVPPAPSQLSTPQAGNTAGKGTPGSTALELSAEVETCPGKRSPAQGSCAVPTSVPAASEWGQLQGNSTEPLQTPAAVPDICNPGVAPAAKPSMLILAAERDSLETAQAERIVSGVFASTSACSSDNMQEDLVWASAALPAGTAQTCCIDSSGSTGTNNALPEHGATEHTAPRIQGQPAQQVRQHGLHGEEPLSGKPASYSLSQEDGPPQHPGRRQQQQQQQQQQQPHLRPVQHNGLHEPHLHGQPIQNGAQPLAVPAVLLAAPMMTTPLAAPAAGPSRVASALGSLQGPAPARLPDKQDRAGTLPQSSSGPKPRGSNALAMMMHKQRERSKVYHFFLEQRPDGSFQWHWWSKGTATAAIAAEAASSIQTSADAVGSAPQASQGPASSAGPDAIQPGPVPPAQAPTIDGVPASKQGEPAHSQAADSAAAQQSMQSLPQAKAVWSATMQVSCAKLGLTGAAAGQKMAVRLATNVAPSDEVSWSAAGLASNCAGPDGRFRGSPGVLKSALQKNVRLCRAGSAVRCALHLIKEDAAEFLRRCSIICLEDAVLHPDLPLLVWLMAANAKGYQMDRSLASACLRIVHQLASVPWRDRYPDVAAVHKAAAAAASQASGQPESGQPAAAFFMSDGGLSAAEGMLVRCIAIRSAYGGMGGDVHMLNGFMAVWAARFAGHLGTPANAGGACADSACPAAGSQWLHFLQQAYAACLAGASRGDGIDVTLAGPIRRGDVPLSAIDFHISNITEELMTQPAISQAAAAAALMSNPTDPAAGDPSERLRRAMWLFRSSLNNKRWLSACMQSAQGARSHAQEDGDHGELAERAALEALWAVAAGPADAWSANFIRRRFF